MGGSDPRDVAYFAAQQTPQQIPPTPHAFPAQGNEQNGGHRHHDGRGGFRGGQRGGRGSRRGGHRGGYRGGHHDQSGSNPQGVVCEYCHNYGHSSAICRKRLRQEAKKAKETPPTPATGFLSAICFSARRCFDWYADSGATRHMTDQRSILTNFVPATHEDWKVTGIGGTQLIVQGQGDVEILSSFNSTKHHGIKLKQFFFLSIL